jgi:predicted RND superfamily exporter protein
MLTLSMTFGHIGGNMDKISRKIVKNKWLILIVSLILVIPAIWGMLNTKINYDILVYLPDDIETMKGENILTNDFNMGAFSLSVVENMNSKDILN